MKSFVINSINGGVNVTFTHDDDSTHTEKISGPLVPITNENGELTQFLTDYAMAYDEGLAAAAHTIDESASALINQQILLN